MNKTIPIIIGCLLLAVTIAIAGGLTNKNNLKTDHDNELNIVTSEIEGGKITLQYGKKKCYIDLHTEEELCHLCYNWTYLGVVDSDCKTFHINVTDPEIKSNCEHTAKARLIEKYYDPVYYEEDVK